MNTIKIGIVGCGVAVEHHVAALKSVQNVKVLWFCDKSQNRALEAMMLWGEDSIAGDNFEMFLGNNKPDAVHICTPPATHADFAIKALEAGCHVLLEKPMATSVEEAEQILQARDMSGRQVCMMHNHIFDPPIIRVRRAFENGTLGKLIYGEGRYFLDLHKMAQEHLNRPDHWAHALKSGIASECLPHTVYLLQSFFGPCRNLQLMQKTPGSSKEKEYPPNVLALQLCFNNAIGRILLIHSMPYGHFNIDLYGTRAAAHINMMDLTSSIERIRGGLPLVAARMESTLEQSLQRLWQTFSNSVNIMTGRLKRRPGHRALIQSFYHALGNGKPVPIPGEDGMATVQTMEQIDRAIADLSA